MSGADGRCWVGGVSVDFRLRREAIALDVIEVFAAVADESRTPVAFSNIE